MGNVGKNIRRIRTERGITQEELAERLFVSRQTVSNYETGRSRPDIDTLMRISHVLETDVQELLCGPQVQREQTGEKRRLAVMCVILAGTGALCEIIEAALKERTFLRYFWSGAAYSRHYLLCPLFLLLLGWVVMQAVSLLPESGISPYPARYSRAAVWGVIGVYYLMAAILCGAVLLFDYQSWQHDLSGSTEAFSRQFSVPVITQCLMFLGRHYHGTRIGAVLLGAALWLTGGKPEKEDLAADEETA